MVRPDILTADQTTDLLRSLWAGNEAHHALLRRGPADTLESLMLSPALCRLLGLPDDAESADLLELLNADGRSRLQDFAAAGGLPDGTGCLRLRLAPGLALSELDVVPERLAGTPGLILLTALARLPATLPDTLADIDRDLPGFIYHLELSPDDVFRYRYVSRGVEPLLGVGVDAVLQDANRLLDLIHPEDRDWVMQQTREQTETLQPWEACFRMRHARDGGLRWIECLDRPQRLADGTVRWIGYANDVTARVEVQARLRHLAHYDPLTALPNRRLSLELAQQALELAQREQRALPLLYLDLDGFKPVNDRHGHAAGDELLREMARRMMAALRASDVVGRVGGDEFIIILPNTDAPADASRVADKLRAAIAEPARLSGAGAVQVSVSIGIAWFPDEAGDVAQLVRRADQAMYQDKRRHVRLAAQSSTGDEEPHGG